MAKLSKIDKGLAANPAGLTSSSEGGIKPTFRVMSVNPKGGNIDDQFALIETEQSYGAPASDPGMRKIMVGDELPEGSVTAITGQGIKVTPPEEGLPEYVIPLGPRADYTPPVKKKTEIDPYYNYDDIFEEAKSRIGDYKRLMPSGLDPRSRIEGPSGGSESEALVNPDDEISINNPKVQEAVQSKADIMDRNTDIYRKHAPDSIDPNDEAALIAYAQDAAAKDHAGYEGERVVAMRAVIRDGIPGYAQVYSDGSVFFTSEDGKTTMRGESIK